MPEANSMPIASNPVGRYSGHTRGASQKPKLLDRLREGLRSRHYSRRTEETYCHWVKRFIFFHNMRHPAEMAEPEINAYLTHLAVKEKIGIPVVMMREEVKAVLGHLEGDKWLMASLMYGAGCA